jgi:hypothetical protein
MVNMVEERYPLSDGFLAALAQTRPDAVRVLRARGATLALLHTQHPFDPDKRCRLTFAGVPGDASQDFDRLVGSQDACVVLDSHPGFLVALQREVQRLGAVPVTAVVPGQDYLLPANVLRRRDLAVPVDVTLQPARLLRTAAWNAVFALPDGREIVLDTDELRTMGQLYAVRKPEVPPCA